MSAIGRERSGRFSARNLPVGFWARRVDQWHLNGDTWWEAEWQLLTALEQIGVVRGLENETNGEVIRVAANGPLNACVTLWAHDPSGFRQNATRI